MQRRVSFIRPTSTSPPLDEMSGVLEETRIHGKNYLLVTDAPEDEDGECYILKDVSGDQEPEALYEFVEDDRELDSVMGVFEALLSDADIEIEK